MENTQDILNELKDLSPTLAALEKRNVFTVPAGYFECLADDILTGISIESGAGDTGFAQQAEKDVPAGYFDSLAESIMAKIKATETEDAVTEIRTLSPMLYSIQNEPVFETPHGYFEGLADEILQKANPKVPVVNMLNRSRSRTFFKYAVAAAFTGMMALGVFKFTAGEEQMVLPNYVTAGLQVESVDDELEKISDAEIVKYLEASGTDVDAALVANSIDKNELPAQEDYLLDDAALDKYLNSIKLDDLRN